MENNNISEIIDLDVKKSKKTVKKLQSEYDELEKIYDSDMEIHLTMCRESEEKLKLKMDEMNKLKSEICKIKNNIEIGKIFQKCKEDIENFDILSKQELSIIFCGIKENLDLDKLIKKIIDTKTKYSNWVLCELHISKSHYKLTETSYAATYKTQHGNVKMQHII